MSAMSSIATELELNWWPTSYGYRHAESDYRIYWWNSNRDTVTLYLERADEFEWVLDGTLLAAVHHAVSRPS